MRPKLLSDLFRQYYNIIHFDNEYLFSYILYIKFVDLYRVLDLKNMIYTKTQNNEKEVLFR